MKYHNCANYVIILCKQKGVYTTNYFKDFRKQICPFIIMPPKGWHIVIALPICPLEE